MWGLIKKNASRCLPGGACQFHGAALSGQLSAGEALGQHGVGQVGGRLAPLPDSWLHGVGDWCRKWVSQPGVPRKPGWREGAGKRGTVVSKAALLVEPS